MNRNSMPTHPEQPANNLSIDIIILCKNNPQELDYTLNSLKNCSHILVSIIIVDGSTDHGCKHIAFSKDIPPILYIDSYSRGIQGIYPSMNLGLQHVSADWFIFLNSGDAFHPEFKFENIYRQLDNLEYELVFAKAIVATEDGRTSWIMPDERIANINQWLKFFEPCHQTFIVRSSRKHLCEFSTECPIGADAKWKEDLIKALFWYYYSEPMVIFKLGGISSTYTLRTLMVMLNEKERGLTSKLAQVTKYCLSLIGITIPQLQKAKSKITGFLF